MKKLLLGAVLITMAIGNVGGAYAQFPTGEEVQRAARAKAEADKARNDRRVEEQRRQETERRAQERRARDLEEARRRHRTS